MTREEQINKEKIYNQLTELLGAIDKQPKSIEVVLDKRQLNIAEEAEKRYLGRPPYQYYSIVDLARAFRDGAEYADTNPKSPWISVEDDLPCNHNNLLVKCLPYNSKLTKPVLALVADGSYKVCDMFVNEEGKWEWSCNDVVLYWFSIPELPKE